jgi:cell division GTPase FtsZ
MNILLLSAGGGGGNILRSLKASFKRDLAVTQQSDSRYAERLRRAVTTRFLDTNEFALSDVPKDERFLIGTETTGRLGARLSSSWAPAGKARAPARCFRWRK